MVSTYYYPTIDCVSREILQNLTAKDIKVLNELYILFRLALKKMTAGHAYIQPSELYIRSKTGYSVCGISRSITRLTNLGLIKTTHRRMRWGKWQTNLYKLGDHVLNKVPWLRNLLKKKESSPFAQNSKLDDKNILKTDSEGDPDISFREWKRISGFKGFG